MGLCLLTINLLEVDQPMVTNLCGEKRLSQVLLLLISALNFLCELKKQLDGNLKNGFVIKRSVFQSCLELYPMTEWKSVMDKINSLNRFIKKNNDFIRIFSAGVRTLELDSSGRFLVPIDLINNSDLKKNIVMASAINIVEIWDKDKYEKSINDKNIDFVKLTEEVMGNQNNELS